MMDVEAHHESSITDRMAKILTIVLRRNFVFLGTMIFFRDWTWTSEASR